MASAALGTQLAQLIHLDTETVKTQIWPHLTSIKTPAETSEYLMTLIGNDGPQQAFIRSFLAFRFPSSPKPSLSQPQGKAPWARPASAAAPSPPSATALSRAHVSGKDRAELERAFGSGGKVYVKSREDQEWGGGGGKKKGGSKPGSGAATPTSAGMAGPPAPAPARRPIEVPVPSLAQPPRYQAPPPAQSNGALAFRSTKKATLTAAETLQLSPQAASQILSIDRELQSFHVTRKRRACFCAARRHLLSPYSPLCPSCGLVLCSLNAPIHPCPSCTHSPLLRPHQISEFVGSLATQRETVITRETSRVQREKDEAERERAAIRFPSLGGAAERAPGVGPGALRPYSNVAGAGPDLQTRIEMAYKTGTSVNGAPFGTEPEKEGKVLRLDSKTKKVKIVTRVEKGKAAVAIEDVALEDEWDDGLVPWLDEDDDGLRAAADKDSLPPLSIVNRPFFNTTVPLDQLPNWTEDTEDERVKSAQQDVAMPGRDTVGEAPHVPGAAQPLQGGKKKRGKGVNKMKNREISV